MIHVGDRYPRSLHHGARRIHLLCKGSRPIWTSPEAQKAMLEMWLKQNVKTTAVMLDDAEGYWFDLAVVLPPSFVGNPADGWTGDLLPGYPPVKLGLFRSETLTEWAGAGAGWDFSPGREVPETMANGWKKWCARAEVPAWWNQIMVDLTATSNRFGKCIEAIQVFRTPVALNYPYTPAEIANGTLESDLQPQFPGATVDVVTGPFLAKAEWHTKPGRQMLTVTMSDSSVTDVRYQGATVGTGYPFPMPAQQQALANMLTAALGGDPLNKAVVMLYGDTWTIKLPDLQTTGRIRDLTMTISPDDPYPGWNGMGEYVGIQSSAGVSGYSGNVRTPEGEPLLEAVRAFARLGFVI